MVPLVSEINELRFVKKVIKAKADELIEASGLKMKYMVGTMIEIPRAAVTADEIAEEAEFFSFGTNDLTQMTYGFSRDDVGRILETYFEKKILESDPFARLDQKGVGRLVKLAVENGKRDPPGHQAWYLRRARRRPFVRRVLPQCRPELRFLLAVPRSDRASGSSTGSR